MPTGLGCFVALPSGPWLQERAGPPPLPAGCHWAHHHWGSAGWCSCPCPATACQEEKTGTLVAKQAFLEDILPATLSPRSSDSPGHEGLDWSLLGLELLELPGLLCSYDCSTVPTMTWSLGGALWCRFRLSQAPTFCSSFEVTCYIWRVMWTKSYLDFLLLSVLSGIQFCLCLVLYFQRPLGLLGRFHPSPVEICLYILETRQASSSPCSLCIDLLLFGEHVWSMLLMKTSLRTGIPEKCSWA